LFEQIKNNLFGILINHISSVVFPLFSMVLIEKYRSIRPLQSGGAVARLLNEGCFVFDNEFQLEI